MYLADISKFDKYEVNIEFTDQNYPETLCGLPTVSVFFINPDPQTTSPVSFPF